MHVGISPERIARRHREVSQYFPRPAAWCCLALGLLVLSAGCKTSARSAKSTEVTGKVTFNGNPLPGGRIVFQTVSGGFASTGDIDESGNYTINAPVGEVQISIDNTMLTQRMETPHPKRPGAEDAKPLKGKFVRLPARYRDITRSGLKYTVKPGPAPQTHDIELNNTPDAPNPGDPVVPGAPPNEGN